MKRLPHAFLTATLAGDLASQQGHQVLAPAHLLVAWASRSEGHQRPVYRMVTSMENGHTIYTRRTIDRNSHRRRQTRWLRGYMPLAPLSRKCQHNHDKIVQQSLLTPTIAYKLMRRRSPMSSVKDKGWPSEVLLDHSLSWRKTLPPAPQLQTSRVP